MAYRSANAIGVRPHQPLAGRGQAWHRMPGSGYGRGRSFERPPAPPSYSRAKPRVAPVVQLRGLWIGLYGAGLAGCRAMQEVKIPLHSFAGSDGGAQKDRLGRIGQHHVTACGIGIQPDQQRRLCVPAAQVNALDRDALAAHGVNDLPRPVSDTCAGGPVDFQEGLFGVLKGQAKDRAAQGGVCKRRAIAKEVGRTMISPPWSASLSIRANSRSASGPWGASP